VSKAHVEEQLTNEKVLYLRLENSRWQKTRNILRQRRGRGVLHSKVISVKLEETQAGEEKMVGMRGGEVGKQLWGAILENTTGRQSHYF
jgi:hypothetical protein